MRMILERFNYTSKVAAGMDGTFGRLLLPNGMNFYTCEPPWEDNKPRISCVPEGQYELFYDESPLITRVTNGKHTGGWELKGVPNRTECKFHPANWPHQLEGCIGVGKTYAVLDNQIGVGQSQSAFDVLMGVLGTDPKEKHTLRIQPYLSGASWKHE